MQAFSLSPIPCIHAAENANRRRNSTGISPQHHLAPWMPTCRNTLHTVDKWFRYAVPDRIHGGLSYSWCIGDWDGYYLLQSIFITLESLERLTPLKASTYNKGNTYLKPKRLVPLTRENLFLLAINFFWVSHHADIASSHTYQNLVVRPVSLSRCVPIWPMISFPVTESQQ